MTPAVPTTLQTLARVLLYGTAESRRAAAEGLLHDGDTARWRLLAATVRSRDDWQLRARCLEVLGLAAAAANQQTAEAILAAMMGPESDPARPT